METLSLKAWRERAAAGNAPTDRQVAKAYSADEIVKESDDRFSFTISTASVDREGDTIAVDGWDLGPFRKNPVVLWAHNHRILPLGRSPDVSTEKDRLRASVEFTPEGLHPFNDTVRRMVEGEFLRATSVGFVPKEFEVSEDEDRASMWGPGVDFLKQELMEFSIVPVPANADALADAKSAGIDLAPIVDWAAKTLDEWSDDDMAVLRISRAHLERCYWKARDGGRILTLDFGPGDGTDEIADLGSLKVVEAEDPPTPEVKIDVEGIDGLMKTLDGFRERLDTMQAAIDAADTSSADPANDPPDPEKSGDDDGAAESVLDEIERDFEALVREPDPDPEPDMIEELLAEPNMAKELLAEAMEASVEDRLRRARGRLD